MPLFYCLKGGFRAARCSFACGITVAPRKAEVLQLGISPCPVTKKEIFHVSENQGKIQGKPHPERYTIAKDTLSHIEHWRGLFIKTYGIAEQKHYKTMYEGLLYGDPKMRILRILWTTIYNDHNARIKEEQNHGKH